MHLVVHLPYMADEDSARALSLARQAPSFTVEWADGRRVATAIFSSLPAGIETAIQLVGEAVRLAGAWASMDSKRVSSLAKLWQRLSCYKDSLEVKNPLRHCREKAALFNFLVGCEQQHCPVPCQFICTPCMSIEEEGVAARSPDRFKIAAEAAEIEWCPRLHYPPDEQLAIIERCSLKSSPAPAS